MKQLALGGLVLLVLVAYAALASWSYYTRSRTGAASYPRAYPPRSALDTVTYARRVRRGGYVVGSLVPPVPWLGSLWRLLTPVVVTERGRWRHVLIFGGTGSGKSLHFIKGAVARDADADLAVAAVDVKHPDLYQHAGDAWERTGKPVYFVNVTGAEGASYEPLHSATPQEVHQLAHLLAAAREAGDPPSDPFWQGQAERIIANAFELVRYFPRRECNMPCAAQLLMRTPAEMVRLWQAVIALYTRPTFPVAVLAAMRHLAVTSAAELADSETRSSRTTASLQVIDLLGHEIWAVVRDVRNGDLSAEEGWARVRPLLTARGVAAVWAERHIADFAIEGNERVAGSSVATAANALSPFANSEVARKFTTSEWTPDRAVGAQALTVIAVDRSDPRSRKLAALFLRVFEAAAYASDRQRPHPVIVYIDELATLGDPALPDNITIARGSRVGLVLAAQDQVQLEALYGTRAQVVEANARTRVYLKGVSVHTAAGVVQAIGTTAPRTETKPNGTEIHIPAKPLASREDIVQGRVNGVVRGRTGYAVLDDSPAVLQVPATDEPTDQADRVPEVPREETTDPYFELAAMLLETGARPELHLPMLSSDPSTALILDLEALGLEATAPPPGVKAQRKATPAGDADAALDGDDSGLPTPPAEVPAAITAVVIETPRSPRHRKRPTQGTPARKSRTRRPNSPLEA